MKKISTVIALMICLLLCLSACGTKDASNEETVSETTEEMVQENESQLHDLVINTKYSLQDTYGPFYADMFGEEYTCQVDINIPEADKSVPDASAINSVISQCTSFMVPVYEALLVGDTSMIEMDMMCDVGVDFHVHEADGTSVLVIETHAVPFRAGGSPVRKAVYYDNVDGAVIGYSEYAEKNGYSVGEVMDAFFATENGSQFKGALDESYLDADLVFYFDKNGNIQFYDYSFL